MRIDLDEMLETIRSLMRQGIDPGLYEKVVSLDGELSDAVMEQAGEIGESEPAFRDPKEESRESYVVSMLGHVSVNPHKPERKDILKNVYIYCNQDHLEDKKLAERFPNLNLEACESFVRYLVRESRREREMYFPRGEYFGDSIRNVSLLYGDRGTGKTFFLNHLFSKYHEILDNEKVIWIRINLSEQFGGNDPDIYHWLITKVCLVVLRYYYKNNDSFRGLVEDVQNHITKEYSSDATPYTENLHQIKKKFCDMSNREALRPGLVKLPIGEQILDWVLKKDFSFIFVLDGYDRFDFTPRQRARFDHLRDRINHHLLDPDTRLGGCYLIVCRTETRRFFGPAIISASSKKCHILHRKLKDASFEAIVNSRLSYLGRKVKELAGQRQWDTTDWPGHIEEFAPWIFNMSDVQNSDEFFLRLQQIHGGNHRAKVQTIQLCYLHFLRNKHFPKRYKLTEALCKAGFKFPPAVYKYELVDQTLVPQTVVKMYDNVFLPILFRFPYTMDKRWKNMPTSRTYLLSGFRLIQLITAMREIKLQEVERFRVPVHTVCKLLNKLFNYDEEIVHLLIYEFYEYGILNLVSNGIVNPDDIHNLSLEAGPKLEYLNGPITHASMMSDVAYLNMSAMRALVNKDVLHGDIPFLRAATIDEEKPDIDDWIQCKVLNTISMFRLIGAINLSETKILRKRLNSDERRFQAALLANTLTGTHEESALTQLRHLLSEPNTRLERIAVALSNYQRYWG